MSQQNYIQRQQYQITERDRMDIDQNGYQGRQNNQENQQNIVESLRQRGVKELIDLVNANDNKHDESKHKKKVCIFWKQGQCKNGDHCTFLHEDIEEKLPLCKYFKETGQCIKGDQCLYRHNFTEDPSGIVSKYNQNVQYPGNEICPYYERGFCYKGTECKFVNSHFIEASKWQFLGVQICQNYQSGFCPYGPDCKQKHLKPVIIDEQSSLKLLSNFPDQENWIDLRFENYIRSRMGQKNQKPVICHNCGQEGHKSTFCQENKIEKDQLKEILDLQYIGQNDKVVCFGCGRNGHYANLCPLKKNQDQGQNKNNQKYFVDQFNPNQKDEIKSLQAINGVKQGGLVDDLDKILKRRKIEQKYKEEQDVILKITGNQINLLRDQRSNINEKNKLFEIRFQKQGNSNGPFCFNIDNELINKSIFDLADKIQNNRL